jgi:uncharacterized membrane protein
VVVGMIKIHNETAIRIFKNLLSGARTFFRASPRYLVRYFIQGLIIVLPLAVTLWLLVWLFNVIDGFLSPILELSFGRHIPGLGFAIVIFLVLLVGYLGTKIGQTRFFDNIEKQIVRIPGIGSVYGGTREILNTLQNGDGNRFMEVVLIEYPRKGIYAIGLVTKKISDGDGEKFLYVFIPTSPSPAGGYLQIVPESEVVYTSMSINDALKLIISIGRLSKEDFTYKLARSSESKKGT